MAACSGRELPGTDHGRYMNFTILCKTLALSNQGLVEAVRTLGNLEKIFSEHPDTLKQWFHPGDISRILHWHKSASIREYYAKSEDVLKKEDVRILGLDNKSYPALLKEIPDPPAVLFLKGDIDNLNLPQIAIVGSRNCTAQGRRIAQEFAAELSAAGFVITSGLALGIDAAAHQGALQSSGKTSAVMGTGLDQVYPERNKPLASRILTSGGTLISEFLPGSPPRAWHFPHRNRVVTGLSLAVLVIEAGERSGSLISARLAAEQGREVFVIPGGLKSPVSAGCNRLIREGATLVTEPRQLVEQLGPLLGFQLSYCRPGSLESQTPPAEMLEKEHWLLSQMGVDPVTIDELCHLCECRSQEITIALAELELEGKVTQTPFGYQRCV